MSPRNRTLTEPRTRTYGQYCPVAAGLDVIGDRWVLLIMRELVARDSRFTDLRRALPGLAPNLLTERLRDLQAAGLVESVDVSRSTTRSIYHITDDGLKITPVLRAVARFGVDYLDADGCDHLAPDDLSAERTARAFLLPWLKSGAEKMRVRIDVPAGTSADIVVDGRRTEIVAADLDVEPDVELHSDALTLSAARRTGKPAKAKLTGSPEAKKKFREAFDLACR